jgi:hypothetical protein
MTISGLVGIHVAGDCQHGNGSEGEVSVCFHGCFLSTCACRVASGFVFVYCSDCFAFG